MQMLSKFWRMLRWPLAIIIVLYRIPAVGQQERTQDALAHIQSQKLTLASVDGSNLPPQPYEPENEATVAGIDKNGNGIRDDVELAIFAEYPDSAKIRAAELQYAMTEQMFLTHVFNTETWKAVAEEDARAYSCALTQITYDQTVKIQALVFDTDSRKEAEKKAYDFTTSHGSAKGDMCDIDLASLSN